MDPFNPFAALDDAASAAVQAAFGIAARIIPYRAATSYSEGGPDPERPPVDLVCIMSSAPVAPRIGGDNLGGITTGSGKLAGQDLVLWITPADVRSIRWEIRKNDRVVLPNVDERYPAQFKIAAVRPTDMGDLELVLSVD